MPNPKAPIKTKLGPAIIEITSTTSPQPTINVHSDGDTLFTVNGVDYRQWGYNARRRLDDQGNQIWVSDATMDISLVRTKWVATNKVSNKAQVYVLQRTWSDIEQALREDPIVHVILKEYDVELGFRRQKQLNERLSNLETRQAKLNRDIEKAKIALVAALRGTLDEDTYHSGLYGE